MRSRLFFSSLVFALGLTAQTGVLTVAEPAKLTVKHGETAVQKLQASLKDGYHANSNKPAEAFLIPLKLTWEPGPLEVLETAYPAPKLEKYEFSEKPLSVVSGAFEISTKFRPAANAALGPGFMTGKLRYQACTDKMCLPPKTVEVKLPVLLQ